MIMMIVIMIVIAMMLVMMIVETVNNEYLLKAIFHIIMVKFLS